MYSGLPHSVVAYGWIPFLIVTGICLVFSIIYILWHRSSKASERAPGNAAIAVLGLFITLLACVLVPVDVFLISYMKNPDGSWKEWSADAAAREALKNSILYAYYFFYAVIITFCFLIIPANYFYHGIAPSLDEDGEEEVPTVKAKLCKSVKWTLLSLLLFSVLVIGGIFIPFNGAPPGNATDWERFEWFIEEMEANKGEDLLLFILNVINIIGMILLIFYTGYGLSSLPCGFIWSRRTVDAQKSNVDSSLEQIEAEIEAIQARAGGRAIPRFEQSQLDRLEQQARLLQRERRDLEQQAKNALNRCLLVLKPFQVIFGTLFAIFGFLIFLSLLLTNVDKAINSDGPFSGYSLQNSTLPNPMDLVLVFCQSLFPLDYILYTLTVLFLLFCSMAGIRNMGIRFCWINLYKIRSWRTPPRGMLLAVLSLMYIIMALNIVMFSLVPDYTMFGNQHFQHNVTVHNITKTVIDRCGDVNFPVKEDNCVPSRISVLLLSAHLKAWIFGAAYYWLTWTFLVSICLGSFVTLYKIRKPYRAVDEDEEDLIDNVDD